MDAFHKPANFAIGDFVDAYHLQLAAETEYDGASTKIAYLTYAANHAAPNDTIVFWTRRAAMGAQSLDDLYDSSVPAFSAAQLNTLKAAFRGRTLFEVGDIASLFAVLESVYDHMAEGRLTLSRLFADPEEEDAAITPVKKPVVSVKTINVTGGKTTESISPDVEAAAGEGREIILKGVSTTVARNLASLFTTFNAAHPDTPIKLADVVPSCDRWKGGVQKALEPFMVKKDR